MLRPLFTASASVALATLAALVGSQACSNNSSGGGGASTSDYCSELSSYASRCNLTDPCTAATIQACSSIASSFSAAALAATVECYDGVACGDAGVSAASTCSQKATASATPTAAQTKLADDYCAACPTASQSTAACVAGFYTTAAVGDGGASFSIAPGNGLLQLSDTLITNIDTKCIPGLSADAGLFGCDLPFVECDSQIVLGALGAATSACLTSGTADGG